MVFKRIEDSLGLPKLSEMKEGLAQVNQLLQQLDEKRLATVKHIADTFLKLQEQGGVGALGTFSQVVEIIAKTPPEKMNTVAEMVSDIKEITGTIERVLKMLPKETLANAPIAELFAKIKEGMKGS